MPSIRDRIKNADDGSSTTITIPEWDDVTVKVVSMSAGQRAQIFEAMQANDGNMPLELFWRVSLISCVLDPDTDEPVFSNDDAEWLLAEKSADVIQRISEVCLQVSGMSDDAVDTAGKGSSGSGE
jgi:hypothetical protein